MNNKPLPHIVYQDDDYIIASKPSGWISGNKDDNDSLLGYLCKEQNKDFHLINRLDRPVSGILLLATSSKSAAAAQKIFQDKQVQKTYYAIVPKIPTPENGRLHHFIKKDGKRKKSIITDHTQGKEAILDLTVLDFSDRYALLKVKTKTGRFHQIRAQLAAKGHPIKGDTKYGARRAHRSHFIHLHACQLELENPFTNKHINVHSMPYDDVLWDFFKERILAEINA